MQVKMSYDCVECIHGKRSRIDRDGNLSAKCKLMKSGAREDVTLHICPEYRFRMFEKKSMKDFLPYVIWIEITNKCNLRCKMCGQRGDHGYLLPPDSKMRRKDLPIEEWKRFIDEVAPIGPQINLRGGEPLLYPHIVEFMRYVHEKGAFLSLETNATYLKKHAYDVARYVDSISISVDGPREVHDYVRGVEGTFDRVKEGILEVKKAMKELGIKKAQPFNLNFVINIDNYHALPQMVDVAKELGVSDLTLSLCYYFDDEMGRQYEEAMSKKFGIEAVTWRGFLKNERDMDFELLVKNVRETINNSKGIRFSIFPNITDERIKTWYEDLGRQVSFEYCHAPWFLVNVMPNGDVNFCTDFGDYVIGNITEQKLLDMWFDEKAMRFREEILKDRFSICKRCGVNQIFPYNRFLALEDVRKFSHLVRAFSKLPFLKKVARKYNWISHTFY